MPPLCTYKLNWAGEPPGNGEMDEMTLPSRHRIRYSSSGSLGPSTLPLGHTEAPQNIEYLRVSGGQTRWNHTVTYDIHYSPKDSKNVILYAYGIVGKAGWAHRSTSHHIKPEPLGEGLMWWLVLRWAHPALPMMRLVFSRKNIWSDKIKLNSEAYRRECLAVNQKAWVREGLIPIKVSG